MRVAILFFCCVFASGQTATRAPETKSQTPTNSSDQKSQNQDFRPVIGTRVEDGGDLEILSDTQGVDFGPYLKQVLGEVRENWYHLVPESIMMKKGKLAIEFAISKDGKITNMRIVASSGDVNLDRPAYSSITASDPFPPLPSEFTGPFLALRLRFKYNPDRADYDNSGKDNLHKDDFFAETHMKTKSGIAIRISAPADMRVPLGGSTAVTATVTGAIPQENTVRWSLTGLGCTGATCGEMTVT